MKNVIMNRLAQRQRLSSKGLIGWYIRKYFFEKKYRSLQENAVRLCDLQPHQHVLEVGFSTGLGLRAALNKLKGSSGKVYGVDLSPVLVERAIKSFRSELRNGQLDLTLGPVTQLIYPNETFDRVFHSNCYHLWPDVLLACRELRRVMKVDARMVTTLDLKTLRESESDRMPSRQRDPMRYMFALEAAGFRDVHIEYLNSDGRDYQAIFAHVEDKPSSSYDRPPTEPA